MVGNQAWQRPFEQHWLVISSLATVLFIQTIVVVRRKECHLRFRVCCDPNVIQSKYHDHSKVFQRQHFNSLQCLHDHVFGPGRKTRVNFNSMPIFILVLNTLNKIGRFREQRSVRSCYRLDPATFRSRSDHVRFIVHCNLQPCLNCKFLS